MDLGPIFNLIADLPDDELLQRLRAMEEQLRPVALTRLAEVPSYISALQIMLERAEEDDTRSEATLDEMRAMLERFRAFVSEDLEKARSDFDALRQQLAERELHSEAVQAQAAAERIAEMQQSQRVAQAALPELDDLYSTLLSSLIFAPAGRREV